MVLVVGGELLVRGASNLAYSIHISPMVVGLTIVAFGTSAPELLISLKSALAGSDAISIGNVVGSNICNLGLVMGITAMFYPIFVSTNSIKVDWLMTMGSALLLYFFISKDMAVNHFEGVIFVLILAIYTYFLIEMSRRETREKMIEDDEEIPQVQGKAILKECLILGAGCVGLYFGAEWFVKGATNIAYDFGVSKRIVGLTIVALGTSLPELVTSTIAAYKKNTDLALGNLLGSCIFNVLSILGITSIIKEVSVTQEVISTDMLWMMGVILLVLPMMISRRKIGRIEGGILIAYYGAFMYFVIISP